METNKSGHKIFYADYTWPEIEGLDRKNVVLVLPTGSVEQHGPHLTLASDATQAEAFARLAALELTDAIVLPAIWYTTCLDTSNYPGTISLNPSLVVEMVCGIITSLYRNGFRKLVIANVHGAAKGVLETAVREFHARMASSDRQYNDDFFIHVHHVYMPAAQYLDSIAEGKDWGHACEMETSVDLYLNPERVNMDLAAEEYIPWKYGVPWYVGDMQAVDKTGIHGAANTATAEKGEKVVAAIVKGLVELLKGLGA